MNRYRNTDFLTREMVNDIQQMYWNEGADIVDIKEIYNIQTAQIKAILRIKKLIVNA